MNGGTVRCLMRNRECRSSSFVLVPLRDSDDIYNKFYELSVIVYVLYFKLLLGCRRINRGMLNGA